MSSDARRLRNVKRHRASLLCQSASLDYMQNTCVMLNQGCHLELNRSW